MEKLSFWSLVIDGGYIMIPLAVLLLVSIYIFIERCFALHRAAKNDETFMKRIRDYIMEGDIDNAVNLCKRTDTPYSRLILKGVRFGLRP